MIFHGDVFITFTMYVYIMFFVILMVVEFMCISITYLKLWKTLCNSMTQYMVFP